MTLPRHVLSFSPPKPSISAPSATCKYSSPAYGRPRKSFLSCETCCSSAAPTPIHPQTSSLGNLQPPPMKPCLEARAACPGCVPCLPHTLKRTSNPANMLAYRYSQHKFIINQAHILKLLHVQPSECGRYKTQPITNTDPMHCFWFCFSGSPTHNTQATDNPNSRGLAGEWG